MSFQFNKSQIGVEFVFLCVAFLLPGISACTPSYPYIVANEGCNCQEYTYRDKLRKFTLAVRASYKVAERISSTIELTFRNYGKDTLDLGQAYIKGTSENVRYQYNGKSLPLPFVKIEPGDDHTITLNGSDTEVVSDPLRKIAGERIVIEVMKLLIRNAAVPTIVITLVPVNPKFSS